MRLSQRRDHQNHQKHIRRRMRELIIALERDFDSYTKRFDAHDGYGANKRTNAHVDDRVCAAAAWRKPVYGVEGVENYEEEVGQENFLVVRNIVWEMMGRGGRTRLGSEI